MGVNEEGRRKSLKGERSSRGSEMNVCLINIHFI